MQTFLKESCDSKFQTLFSNKKNPITMSPESKLLVILSTRDIIACCVECF